jgi:hypothetical protein
MTHRSLALVRLSLSWVGPCGGDKWHRVERERERRAAALNDDRVASHP